MQNYTKAWPWNFLFNVFEDQVEVDKIHRNPPQDLEDTVLHVILTMQTHCFQSFSGPSTAKLLSLLKEKYDVTLPISDAERAVLENVKADSNLHDAKVI